MSWRSKLGQLAPTLLLALACTSAWAPPGRPTYHPPPISRPPTIERPPPVERPTVPPETIHRPGVDPASTTENASVKALRGAVGLDGKFRGANYSADLATALYFTGLVSLGKAEELGYSDSLERAWERFRGNLSREPTTVEWRTLLQTERTRAEQERRLAAEEQLAKRERATVEAKRALDERVSRYEARAAPLTAEVVRALQSARDGRTAVMDPDIPDVVVRLADSPALDRTIIDHMWFRHATALKSHPARKTLHVVNLFPDPVGDTLLRQIGQYIGDETGPGQAATAMLRNMLTGGRTFDTKILTQALTAAPGHTIYIVSHIPDSAPGTGKVEFEFDGKVTATPISQMQAAFSEAKVNLFVVGCSSAHHAATGLSKEVNNVDALTGFLRALQTGADRSLFGWHAAFAANAKVVVDPLAAEVFGAEAVAFALSKAKLERDGRTISTGYVGTFAPPPSQAGTGTPSSTVLSVALNAMSVPSDLGDCRGTPSFAQIEVASRWVPIATTLLLLSLCIGSFSFLREELSTATEPNYVGSLFAPLMLGLPIIFTRYQWGACLSDCNFNPGPFLPGWCLLYAALFGFIWASDNKRGLNLLFMLTLLLAGAGVIFGASYVGWGADPNIQRFCDAVLKP